MERKTVTCESMVALWKSAERQPIKGQLIDDDGCKCAQGQVLACVGFSDDELRRLEQRQADIETARALGISVTHSILLRKINDSQDGCPQDVIEQPQKIIGDEAARVLKFWVYLDSMDAAAWDAAWDAAGAAAWDAAGDAAWDAAWDAARAAAWDAARAAARAASRATNEIQGHKKLKSPIFFLPLFGIKSIEELDALP